MKTVLSMLAVILGAVTPCRAAIFPVTNGSDSGPGSLRAAVLAANGSAGADEILLASITGTIVLQSSLPSFSGDTILTGPGAASLTISGNSAVQILTIDVGSTVRISSVTFADGLAVANANGGAIANHGTLTLIDCFLSGNRTVGGFGGAIYSDDDLTLLRCEFANNRVTGGTSTGSGTKGGLGGGGGGFGGAIYHATGALAVTDCIFRGNSATGGNGATAMNPNGAAGTGGTGGGPNGGAGGGRPATGPGTPGTLGGFGSGGGGGSQWSTVSGYDGGAGGGGGFGGGGGGGGGGYMGGMAFGNTGGQGGQGGYGAGVGASGGAFGDGQGGGGGAGFGGAIFTGGGSVQILRSQFLQNSASGGAASSAAIYHNTGSGGGSGMGGAFFNYGGAVTVEGSVFRENEVSGGAGGGGTTAGSGGQAGGGALNNFGGLLQLLQSTLTSNRATGGEAGAAGRFGSSGGSAVGGAISVTGGAATLVNSTFSQNSATGGRARAGSFSGGYAGSGTGGALGGNANLLNCTITQNQVQNGVYYPLIPSSPTQGLAVGGGISTGLDTTAKNTIVAGNFRTVTIPAVANTPSDGNGSITSFGHNLFENTTGFTGFVATDLVNVSPLLGPLQNNAGSTQTHAIPLNSPAFDAGDNAGAPATDQRGVARPQGGRVDIGAFEVSAFTIQIDGSEALPGTVTHLGPATVSFQTTFSAGAILYTLDGSAPTLASTLYQQPFQVTSSVTIRAIAFDSGFASSVLAGPVQLNVTPLRTLSVTTSGQGSITRTPSITSYPNGSTVTLTATPAVGWSFAGWSGDLSGSASPATLTMDADKAVLATFAPIPTYTLAVSKVGQGSVSISPTGPSYLAGTTVTLTATPAAGWSFSGWSGDVNGTTSPVTVTMDANKAVTANFSAVFSISATTSGDGNVSLSPAQSLYAAGSNVSVTANASSGWQFLGWLGDLAGTNAAEMLTVSRNHSVEAVFGTTLATPIVGQGSVLTNPALALYPKGTRLRLSAVPAAGYYFAFWGNPVNSSASSVDFPITMANASVSAVFLPLDVNEYSLSVVSDGAGNVVLSPAGGRFVSGAVVQLTAIPDPGQQFLGWSGGATGSLNPLSVTLTASTTIVAHFTTIPRLWIFPDQLALRAVGARIFIEGRIGDVYQVEAVETLTGTWVVLGTVTNTLGKAQFPDGDAQTEARHFYRARALP